MVLNDGVVDAGRIFKRRNIATTHANKNPCDHHNLLNGDYEVGDILKNKLLFFPSGGVGHKYINAEAFTKPSVIPSQKLITMMPFNKLPSGPSGGVGHSNND